MNKNKDKIQNPKENITLPHGLQGWNSFAYTNFSCYLFNNLRVCIQHQEDDCEEKNSIFSGEKWGPKWPLQLTYTVT